MFYFFFNQLIDIAAELCLASLSICTSLKPQELYRALDQCGEHSNLTLERGLLVIEQTANQSPHGILPEIYFILARSWFSLYHFTINDQDRIRKSMQDQLNESSDLCLNQQLNNFDQSMVFDNPVTNSTIPMNNDDNNVPTSSITCPLPPNANLNTWSYYSTGINSYLVSKSIPSGQLYDQPPPPPSYYPYRSMPGVPQNFNLHPNASNDPSKSFMHPFIYPSVQYPPMGLIQPPTQQQRHEQTHNSNSQLVNSSYMPPMGSSLFQNQQQPPNHFSMSQSQQV